MLRFAWALTFGTLLAVASTPCAAAELPGFRKSAWFDERVREQWIDEGVRVLVQAPASFDPKKPTRLVIFATPNGNTIEQSLGCGLAPGLDWHFDIQHVSAQVRRLRELTPSENIVLACTEAEGLSWPAWKRKRSDGPARIRKVVETIKSWVPGTELRLTLAAHSGGGSFLNGFVDGGAEISAEVERIVFLDANYSYSDTDKHGDKLLAWLRGARERQLVVIAYDDRKITFNGKLVVGPDGGTYRATERMRARFAQDVPLKETTRGDFQVRHGLDGQIRLLVHANPKNIILHTALVGEMNGLLYGLTGDEAKPNWGSFGGPRAYTSWVQPAPGIPARPSGAIGGAEFFRKVDGLSPADREEAVAVEICRGNIPDFLRAFRKVEIEGKDRTGKQHKAVIEVMPDYLAVGSDSDFVRVPMTPMTAGRIAERFGCSLPTRKLVDDIHRAAAVKLEPRPLTKAREAPATFVQHNEIIEGQRQGQALGELVSGIKKDVVLSNRIGERPERVAIYGWHKLDGAPIQPLTIVHWNRYVDYSHGVRLLKRAVDVDGVKRDFRSVLYSEDLCGLLSDEGPIEYPSY